MIMYFAGLLYDHKINNQLWTNLTADSATIDLDHGSFYTIFPDINFDDDFFDGKDLLKALARQNQASHMPRPKLMIMLLRPLMILRSS